MNAKVFSWTFTFCKVMQQQIGVLFLIHASSIDRFW